MGRNVSVHWRPSSGTQAALPQLHAWPRRTASSLGSVLSCTLLDTLLAQFLAFCALQYGSLLPPFILPLGRRAAGGRGAAHLHAWPHQPTWPHACVAPFFRAVLPGRLRCCWCRRRSPTLKPGPDYRILPGSFFDTLPFPPCWPQAAVLLVQEALPHLLQRPGASIVLVSSVTAFRWGAGRCWGHGKPRNTRELAAMHAQVPTWSHGRHESQER